MLSSNCALRSRAWGANSTCVTKRSRPLLRLKHLYIPALYGLRYPLRSGARDRITARLCALIRVDTFGSLVSNALRTPDGRMRGTSRASRDQIGSQTNPGLFWDVSSIVPATGVLGNLTPLICQLSCDGLGWEFWVPFMKREQDLEVMLDPILSDREAPALAGRSVRTIHRRFRSVW